MTTSRLAAAAFTALLWAGPVAAGPCTADIDLAQAKLDKRIDAVAGAGAAARQSTAAQMHREPTPGSIASAEQKLGEGSSVEPALAALRQARMADTAGDKAGCERALADVARLLGP